MKSKEQPIFIHLPKTGGTTINCAMRGSKWQTKPDFYYRHIDYKTKTANCADIFQPANRPKYQDHHIFSIFRLPEDRLLSEYHFLKSRPEFFDLINPAPKDFMEYCSSLQTQNYCTKFLLGKRIFTADDVSENEFNSIEAAIDHYPVYLGLFEQFEKSLHYFSQKMGIQWKDRLERKRITLNRPELSSLTEDEVARIRSWNVKDMRLYALAQRQLDSFTPPDDHKILFTGDRYDYVMIFARRFNLLEIDLKHTGFIAQHQAFFRKLNLSLFARVKSGKEYVTQWNRAFIQSCERAFPNTILLQELHQASAEDPLERTIEFCRAIDRVFEQGLDPDQENYNNQLE